MFQLTISDVITSPVWPDIIAALRENKTSQEKRVTIHGDKCYLLPQVIDLTSRQQRKFVEAHRDYIDVQCCYEGEELIECPSSEGLEELNPYNADGDYYSYKIPTTFDTAVTLLPGRYTIFLPKTPHLPGIAVKSSRTHKAVIKVHRNLINGSSLIKLIGPFPFHINYGKNPGVIFDETASEDLYDKVDDFTLTPQYYPIDEAPCNDVYAETYLLNFARKIETDEVLETLPKYGLLSAAIERFRYLGVHYHRLMDYHPVVTLAQLPSFGKRDGRYAMCMHNHNGVRRLRRHFADAPWNEPVRFAVDLKIEL